PLLSGQAARAAHISKDMLRHWQRCGLLEAPRNPHNRYRQYGACEIERLRIIRMLIRSGYSTMAVLRMLTQLDEGKTDGLRDALDTPRPDEDIFSASDRWLTTLQEELERIGRIQAFLDDLVSLQAPSA
ncbi:MAG: MerR family transcriptional regulator, partial [Anaerolineaceae bacterium]